MPTCRDIITRAMQQAGIVALRDVPTASEAEAGLKALQGIYDGWVAAGMFGRMTDVYTDEDYTAGTNERIFADGATVTIPDLFLDPDGQTTVPRDLSLISVHDGSWRHYLWTNDWVELGGLTLDSTAPLSERDSEGLSSLLATYLAEGFGRSVGPMTARRGLQFQGNVSMKFGSTQDIEPGEYF